LEALTAVHRQTYDLILMDIQMPEMDGLEASARIVQEFEVGRRPRMVALTANVFKADRDACLAAGMDGFLGKPLEVAQLQEALMQCQPLARPEDLVA
jgi:CheY-like chemotaxis protein